jgi:hypothetical protein
LAGLWILLGYGRSSGIAMKFRVTLEVDLDDDIGALKKYVRWEKGLISVSHLNALVKQQIKTDIEDALRSYGSEGQIVSVVKANV